MSVDRILSTVRRKHASNEWRVDHRPEYGRWETYRIPIDWPDDMFNWLIDNFGRPNSSDKWDLQGGWIYFYKEECASMFMLKWS